MKVVNIFFTQNKQLAWLSIVYLFILISWYTVFAINNNSEVLFSLYPKTFYFEPHISTYLLEKTYSISFLSMTTFFTIVIIPYTILVLLFNVYSKFVEPNYAFLFSLLSVSISNEKNFREFLYLLSQNNLLEKITTTDFPLIFKFPFPSLSSLVFLFLFIKILNLKKTDTKQEWYLSILVAISFYINALDALFLFVMWFFTLFIKQQINKKRLKRIFILLTLTCVVILPGVLSNTLSQNYQTTTEYNHYNLFLYNLLPIVLTIIFFRIKRIDPQEIWYKFKYVYEFLATELFVNLLAYSKLFIIDLSVLNRQAPQFIIHLLYYTPIVYYLSRQPMNYRFGTESSFFSIQAASILYNLFNRLKKVLFYVMVALLLMFNLPLILFI